ncbi:cryptochrome/photolyase family protein [Mesorhizobium sp. YIM 152430]|uniref:cryptochrome/photolyase family protein n=1 Tax=Mesorhizobium sp. YIM 152430 TaxID=3031761 RepID=UPI0023DAA31E|nr:cryptochrome/photolyase family protein [Mesorhizobium sp. YIM 152430]MDF1598769.1 cryptochrome/photolyase family protein [Mesorhizobium sp. YIM 152430]
MTLDRRKARRLVFILGDQLSPEMSSLRDADPGEDVLLLCEVAAEANYVRHHKQKIAFIFSAMRHFADEMRQAGWTVDYVKLTDRGNSGSFTGELGRAVKRHRPERVIATEPGEWRVMEMMRGWEKVAGCPVEIRPDTRFLASHDAFAEWAEGRKQLTMEYFYRQMRRKTGLLMEGDAPAGGKWNYDSHNRKPAGDDLFMPQPNRFAPDAITREVIALIEDRFADHFGTLENFGWAVTRKDAERARDAFLENFLAAFGDYQDAMLAGQPFLYHSLLSPYVNAGLLDPLDLCRRVNAAWRAGDVPLNAAEGFIRQIIGWREYVRGVYWLKMPDYGSMNVLGATRALPDFYWTGETDMNCMAHVVRQTRAHAYAHHIQRLMVTGTFALLAGIDPRQVHEWYLAVYADAYEWVELPNVIGMSQFADGGILGSKPYAASGAYIDRMSDYCGSCRYDVKRKTGPDACPFNPLYWDFLDRNSKKLSGNQRLAQVYRYWARMDRDKRRVYLDSAADVLKGLDDAPKTYGQGK